MISAGRAGIHRRIGSSAIVAKQLVGEFVIRQRNITIFTLWNPPADLTNLIWRITPAITKKNHLLFMIERILDRLLQDRCDNPFGSVFQEKLLCIDELYHRHGYLAISFQQFTQSVFARDRVIITLYGRRGGPQQRFRLKKRGIVDSRVPSMIAGSGILLFVGTIMFLVNDHQGKI